MEPSKIKDFISTYCGIPSESPSNIVSVTEEEIIDNFITYIKNICINQHNLVKYKMPTEFYGRVDKNQFWRIIIDFITREMDFEDYNLGEWKPELVYSTEYTMLRNKEFFLVTEKKYTDYDNYVEDYIALDINKIDKIVFRIYKNDLSVT